MGKTAIKIRICNKCKKHLPKEKFGKYWDGKIKQRCKDCETGRVNAAQPDERKIYWGEDEIYY